MNNLLDISFPKNEKMSKVNLDALIPRADFIESAPHATRDLFSEITLSTLAQDSYSSQYDLFRKPDFQRETNEWDKAKIADLIDCFMRGNFIPSIILWKSAKGLIYVIDGAHRLSALVAYINDDYGDEEISQKYFEFRLSDEEITLAKQCREFINEKIGSFKKILQISKHPHDYEKDEIIRAHNFRTFVLKVQWVTNAMTAEDAERSFFKINQQGVALSTTEKQLCKSRKKANCITTRGIMKGGAGHQYWGHFETDVQTKFKALAQELNAILFKPEYKPNISAEFYPIGGQPTSAMPMIFDFVNIVNKPKGKLSDDFLGNETLEYIRKTRQSIWLIATKQPSSLNLHPLVYFYNAAGAYQQSAFLAVNTFIIDLAATDRLVYFTEIRKDFEDFLVKYKIFVTQIIRKYGSNKRSYKILFEFYYSLYNLFIAKKTEKDILSALVIDFDFLTQTESELEQSKDNNFNTETKHARVIEDELKSATRCTICDARVHSLGRSIDHDKDKKFGGDASLKNSASTHPYCNSAKDKILAYRKKKAIVKS